MNPKETPETPDFNFKVEIDNNIVYESKQNNELE
jgi:hypothetical protein